MAFADKSNENVCVSCAVTNVSNTFPNDQVSDVETVHRTTFGIGHTVGNGSDGVRWKCRRLWRERTPVRNRCPGRGQNTPCPPPPYRSSSLAATTNDTVPRPDFSRSLPVHPSTVHGLGSVVCYSLARRYDVPGPFSPFISATGFYYILCACSSPTFHIFRYIIRRTPAQYANCFVPTSVAGCCKRPTMVRPNNCIFPVAHRRRRYSLRPIHSPTLSLAIIFSFRLVIYLNGFIRIINVIVITVIIISVIVITIIIISVIDTIHVSDVSNTRSLFELFL